MRKLKDAEARALMALVREREEAEAAVSEYVQFLGRDMKTPGVRQESDGLYVVDMTTAETED